MAHSHHLHDHDLIRKGPLALVIGTVWASFIALAVGATVYDVGKWVAAW
jgi:hypothetical protein